MAGIAVTAATTPDGKKTSSKGREAEPAYRALLRTIGLLKRAMEPYFAGYGISASQWAMLLLLTGAHDNGEQGVRLTDLSDDLLIRPPSVTGAVHRLEKMGLVARKASRTDQRARIISLTASGRKLVERVRNGHAERVQRVLEALSLPEQREMQTLLNRLADHLEALTHHNNGSDSALRSRL